MLSHNLEERVRRYAEEEDITLVGRLGHGVDGSVFSTSRQTAVKVHRHEPLYQKERDVYLRLDRLGIRELRGFQIPELTTCDDDFLILEMTTVQPPFALDFAGAYLDKRPDYPEEVMQEWRAEKEEQFGAERWGEVQSLMAAFAKYGIYLADVKPGNIEFENA